MTVKQKTKTQPPIQIRESDAERITNIAIAAEDHSPQVAVLLLGELSRAQVMPDSKLADDIVAMQSSVTFIDEANGIERSLQLVYPPDADIASGRISILSLVGAGLLGLRAGQAILWPDRSGKQRQLRIVNVVHG